MEASARFLSPAGLNRGLLLRPRPRPLPPLIPNPSPINTRAHHLPSFRASLPKRPINPSPLFSLLSLSLSLTPSLSHSFSPPSSDPKDGPRRPDPPRQAIDEGDQRVHQDGGPIWTVVLLGWLGAEIKHLKKYADLYTSRGFRAVRFVVPVKEFLGFDLGRRIEDRVGRLARELVEWCDEKEREGREPRLLFHTFSNAGWLSYGIILENLQSRSDIIEKIKGSVFDSGPAPEINPKVWAAGFGAALLKKRSTLTNSAVESISRSGVDDNRNRVNMNNIRPSFNEIVCLFMLEKFFTVALMLPDVNRRLNRIITTLSKNQPPCPQLYLYSSGDKVVPVQSVEHFIEQQRALGMIVHGHDFVTSPHVDHYRNYTHIYSSEVYEFLRLCSFPTVCEV